jgi:hypothetical protein
MAPEGSAVLYGQPDEGVVLVKITSDKKEQMEDLLTAILDGQSFTNQEIETIRRKLNGYQNH